MKVIVSHLNIKIKRKDILKDIDFHLENHIYGFMGPNGSGKTTCIRAICDFISPTSGNIFFEIDGQKVSLKKLNIGYLPQSFHGFLELTVREMLMFFGEMKDIDKDELSREVINVCQKVNLEDKIDEKCMHLSGGMIRRLGIAQAIMGHPHLILLDEPTTGLDIDEKERFKAIMKEFDHKIPVLISTHNVEDVENLCSHYIFLKKGQSLESGSLIELCQKYNQTSLKELYKYVVHQESTSLL